MTSIVTANVSFASAQTVQNATPANVQRETPPSPQTVQQQLAQISQVVAEKNLSTADSRKRRVLNAHERVQGGFAPERQDKADAPKVKADSRAARKPKSRNLDVEA